MKNTVKTNPTPKMDTKNTLDAAQLSKIKGGTTNIVIEDDVIT